MSKILKVDALSPDEKVIEFAASVLRNGGLVAFPTETVYGLGANSLNTDAIKKLYEIKKRPENKPFTLHISTIDMVKNLGCDVSGFAEKLIQKYWPGPLTLILKSGNKKIGFRMPKNSIAKDLISKAGIPVAAPSANLSGGMPPGDAGEIPKELINNIDLVLDSGKTEFGKESTIVDLTSAPYKILRKGAIPESEIELLWNKAE